MLILYDWQPRPDDGMSKSMTPTSFLYPFGSGGHRTQNEKFMEEKTKPQNSSQTSLCLKINYDTSIRCIDLENIMSGFRLIFQYELANLTGMPTRSFTDVVKIESIEKGSITINFLFDLINLNTSLVEINVNLLSVNIDLLDIFLLYLTTSKNKDKLQFPINSIKSSIKHVKSIILKGNGKSVELKADENGEIKQSNTNN